VTSTNKKFLQRQTKTLKSFEFALQSSFCKFKRTMTTIWFFDPNDWCDEQDLAMLHFFCGDLCSPTQSHEEQEATVLSPQHHEHLSPEYEPTAVAPETPEVAASPLLPPATAVPPPLRLVPPLAVRDAPPVEPAQGSLKKAWHNKLTLRERGTKFSDL